MAVANCFRLSEGAARDIVTEVAIATRGWRQAAARHGLSAAQVEGMESAFEHDDLPQALAMVARY